jgi:fructose-1,6-bisphosphatase I
VCGWQRVLELQPTGLHQRVPIYIGSSEDVDEVVSYL